jgi:predicted RNA-binding protein with PIN domain
MRQIIIDGYNVIRADPLLQRLEHVSLEDARCVLIRTLNASPRLRNDAITVVFDGVRDGRSYINSHRQGHVTVVFSARGQSADEVIKARVRTATHPSDVVVVTNDLDIRRYCQALGCRVSGSENLLAQLAGPQQRRRTMGASSDTIAPEDEDWRPPQLSTVKRGNPRRRARRDRRPHEYRF